MAHRGGFSRGAVRQRKHWHSIAGSTVNFTASATAILGTFTAASGDPFTVLRSIGSLLVWPTGGGTFVASDEATITFGIGKVSADAAALGFSAMPDPADEPDYDWLWWYAVQIAVTETTQVGVLIPSAERVRIESKGMRKFKPRESLVMVGQYVDIAGAPPISARAGFRFLVGE